MGYASRGYAKNIGRLGALAVALGVGYGVAEMPVAFADDAAASDASAPARGGKVRAGSASGGGDSTAGPARHRGAVRAPAPEADLSASDVSPVPNPAASVRPRVSNNDAPVSAAAASAPAPAPAVPVATAVSAPAAPVVQQPAVNPAPVRPSAATAAVAPAATTAQSVAPAPAAAFGGLWRNFAPAVAPQRPLAKLVSLVSSALAPLLGNGTGGAPGQSPLLFSVLAWARKEFERISGITLPAAVSNASLTVSPNLLVNPGAELSNPSLSGFSAVSMPGWTVTGTPTVIKYDTPRVIMPLGLAKPLPTLPAFLNFPKASTGPSDGGAQFFGGGNVADSSITQTVDLSGAGAKIDVGNVSYNLGAWLGGYGLDPSAASVKVTFLDANKTYLGTGKIGPVTIWDRLFAIGFKERSTTGTLPVGTRYAQVDVIFDDKNPIYIGTGARYNDAFADNISFTIGADLPAPAAPKPVESIVGPLKHVYMVYMENKGYSNVVGSPDAPFLNSLINAYGFADNYYALTHGSLPNYYPVVGGDNFGITYNCAEACIDVPLNKTLPGLIDAAGLTWRSYAQGLQPGADPTVSSGDYSFDQTGFPAFSAISGAYAKQHIVPLEQMAEDLKSTATAPNFAWWAADEDNNGEGPVDFPWGALKFALNQLDPKHPYNVKALDAFLAQTVPTIMNSNAWKSDEASVIVVTFDEDNNNTSLGFGNEGNHIATVVIPNKAAVEAGMREGHFVASDQYNHYSLLRMIEESLGLPTLTQNDKFAQPMNEFWLGVNKNGVGNLV